MPVIYPVFNLPYQPNSRKDDHILPILLKDSNPLDSILQKSSTNPSTRKSSPPGRARAWTKNHMGKMQDPRSFQEPSRLETAPDPMMSLGKLDKTPKRILAIIMSRAHCIPWNCGFRGLSCLASTVDRFVGGFLLFIIFLQKEIRLLSL